jgi:chromosome segregation ATPase
MKVEEDIANCLHLMETLRMPSLPDQDKHALSEELTKLESRREEIKKSLEEKISHLAKSNSWPIHPRTEAEEGEVEKYQEMVKYVEELKNTATEMNRVLNDIREHKTTVQREHATPMDVDLPAGSTRPLKRRRLSDTEQLSPTIPTDEVDALRDTFLDLEARFSAFENDLTEHNQELMQEVKAYIEAKVEEIAAVVKDTSTGDSSDSDPYDKADQEIKRMGGEVVELAEEMGALLLRANGQETETATLQREINESKQEYISVGS